MRYAFAVGLLIALCSSLLGVTLVLKRFSFIGDGLSHVAFGAMAVATITGLTNKMIIILPVTLLSAVLLLRTVQNTKIRGDAAVAIISVGALAIGYMLMNLFPSSAAGLRFLQRFIFSDVRAFSDSLCLSRSHQAAQ